MTTSISTLHKILKDATRQKIIVLVDEQGSMTYTELLNALSMDSTGLLNYHLKVLGDLLEKNGDGLYRLSEKGKTALKLISEFPADSQGKRSVWQRRILIAFAVGQAAYFTIAIVFFYLGYIDLYRLTTATSAAIIGSIVIYFIWKMRLLAPMPPRGSTDMHRRIKFGYVAGGVSGGLLIAFFGAGVLFRLISDIQGIPFASHPLYQVFWSTPYLVFAILIAPALGAYIGYQVGKRQGFEQPKWARWLTSRFGY